MKSGCSGLQNCQPASSQWSRRRKENRCLGQNWRRHSGLLLRPPQPLEEDRVPPSGRRLFGPTFEVEVKGFLNLLHTRIEGLLSQRKEFRKPIGRVPCSIALLGSCSAWREDRRGQFNPHPPKPLHLRSSRNIRCAQRKQCERITEIVSEIGTI